MSKEPEYFRPTLEEILDIAAQSRENARNGQRVRSVNEIFSELEGRPVIADLSGMQFPDGTDLSNSTDLSFINLSGSKFTNTHLLNANLSNAVLDGADFSGANLESAHFQGTLLNNANFTGTNMTNANLAAAHTHNTNFTGANFTGVNEHLMYVEAATPPIIAHIQGMSDDQKQALVNRGALPEPGHFTLDEKTANIIAHGGVAARFIVSPIAEAITEISAMFNKSDEFYDVAKLLALARLQHTDDMPDMTDAQREALADFALKEVHAEPHTDPARLPAKIQDIINKGKKSATGHAETKSEDRGRTEH